MNQRMCMYGQAIVSVSFGWSPLLWPAIKELHRTIYVRSSVWSLNIDNY
jgi:hypothetical protein